MKTYKMQRDSRKEISNTAQEKSLYNIDIGEREFQKSFPSKKRRKNFPVSDSSMSKGTEERD